MLRWRGRGLRDRIQLAEEPPEGAVEWLVQAARFERDVQGDVLAAERHLAVAIRISPRDKQLASRYREVAAVVAARARRDRDRFSPEREARPPGTPFRRRRPSIESEQPASDTFAPPGSDNEAEGASDSRDVELCSRLEAAVLANPGDEVLALELADVLFRLSATRRCLPCSRRGSRR